MSFDREVIPATEEGVFAAVLLFSGDVDEQYRRQAGKKQLRDEPAELLRQDGIMERTAAGFNHVFR